MRINFRAAVGMLLIFTTPFISCSKDDNTDRPIVVPPPPPPGKSFFVSNNSGADGNTGLSTTAAFKTISAGINIASPGDTVFVMDGMYTASLNITKSGTASGNITIKALPANNPKVYISGNIWNALSINGSYITVEGIEFMGDNANITYNEAFAAFTAAVAGGSPNGKYNTNGISIGGPGTQSKYPHHVTIRNCKIHDFPGGGLSSIQADYTTFEGNKVYNNAWYMMYAGSGISILTPSNSDGADIKKYKNIIRNNVCYGNKTTIPWISLVPARLSDGNGIIIDVNQAGYDGTGPAYGGRTLVENNVSFNNGGSGIHSYKADHVDMINNTVYNNGTVVGYPDLYAGSATDVKIANNIIYSAPGGKCNATPTAGTFVTYDYNIYFNGTVAVKGANDKVLDPKFINPGIDGNIANFNVQAGSPAIDAGTKIIYSLSDIKGITRPQGGGIDCGAYEYK